MVIVARTREEFERIIAGNRFVLVAVYDTRDPRGRYISGLVDDIARSVEPIIRVAVVDASESPELARSLGRSLPRLLLFIDGRKSWEQIGFFYTSSSDRYAVRRGLLLALRSRGFSPRSLGVRLDF